MASLRDVTLRDAEMGGIICNSETGWHNIDFTGTNFEGLDVTELLRCWGGTITLPSGEKISQG
jgi:hypothetical protein